MSQFKSSLWLGALAAVALIAGGTGSAKATEAYFGQFTPSPGCATSATSGDEGLICPNSQVFTTPGGQTFTATGYSDTFTTGSALTLKATQSPPGPPTNPFIEGGLGENAAGATSCTDDPGGGNPSTPCEIGINASVKVTSDTAITDVLVGSVQGPELFQVWTATTTGGALSLFGSTLSAATCTTGPDGAGECEIDLPDGIHAVGVLDLPSNPTGSASDVLLTAVSYNAVPAPVIGHGLAVFSLSAAWCSALSSGSATRSITYLQPPD